MSWTWAGQQSAGWASNVSDQVHLKETNKQKKTPLCHIQLRHQTTYKVELPPTLLTPVLKSSSIIFRTISKQMSQLKFNTIKKKTQFNLKSTQGKQVTQGPGFHTCGSDRVGSLRSLAGMNQLMTCLNKQVWALLFSPFSLNCHKNLHKNYVVIVAPPRYSFSNSSSTNIFPTLIYCCCVITCE